MGQKNRCPGVTKTGVKNRVRGKKTLGPFNE
jgi:hypothetical protein